MNTMTDQDLRVNVRAILGTIAARMAEIQHLVDLASVDADATEGQREALLSAIQLVVGSIGELADSADRALAGEAEPVAAWALPWARPWAAAALQALYKGANEQRGAGQEVGAVARSTPTAAS